MWRQLSTSGTDRLPCQRDDGDSATISDVRSLFLGVSEAQELVSVDEAFVHIGRATGGFEIKPSACEVISL